MFNASEEQDTVYGPSGSVLVRNIETSLEGEHNVLWRYNNIVVFSNKDNSLETSSMTHVHTKRMISRNPKDQMAVILM